MEIKALPNTYKKSSEFKFIYEYIKSVFGKFSERVYDHNNGESYINFSKKMFSFPSILMVVQLSLFRSKINDEIAFFLYDKETSLLIGYRSHINISEDDWRERLTYYIFTCEYRLKRSICPNCGFWIQERVNRHSHFFLGCSGYPECEYSEEINNRYEDAELYY